MRLPERGCADRSGDWPVCWFGLLSDARFPGARWARLTQSGKAAQNAGAGSLNLREAQLPLPGCWAFVFPTSGALNLNDYSPLGHGIASRDLRPFFGNSKPIQPGRHISGTGEAIAPARKAEGFDRQPPSLTCLPKSSSGLKAQRAVKRRPRHQWAIGFLKVVTESVDR